MDVIAAATFNFNFAVVFPLFLAAAASLIASGGTSKHANGGELSDAAVSRHRCDRVRFRLFPRARGRSLHEVGTCSAEVRRSSPLNVAAPAGKAVGRRNRDNARQRENGITSRETRLIAVRRLTLCRRPRLGLERRTSKCLRRRRQLGNVILC